MDSDRRQSQCCLCSCLQRGAREVHRFHTKLSWRARALSALGQRWILTACEHAVRSDEELTPMAFAYQVESALTVNAVVDHN